MRGKFSMEILVHYQCGECCAWWTIGDGDPNGHYTCPLCSTAQGFDEAPAFTTDDDGYSLKEEE